MFDTYTSLDDSNHSQPRVTALLACHNNLMPVSWHMPISKSPFRYAVAVREENYTHKLLQKHRSFTLNFLPFEHYETVNLLGKTHGDSEDKLTRSGLQVEGWDNHQNLLLGASDFIYECEVCDTYENGDHTVFVVDVTKIHVNKKQSKKPMLFSGCGQYATLGQETIAEQSL